MKVEFEQSDLQRIADMVAEKLMPVLMSKTPAKASADDYFLDVPELCKYISVSERWVRDKVSQKGIPYKRIGGILRFSKREIDGYLKARSNN